ncbi:MAG: ATP-binding cassette domain-containing protein [Fibrobacteria bacterium]|nr:ATP-binding cassette domain-containing protein [Fibrobacteria bacterium]
MRRSSGGKGGPTVRARALELRRDGVAVVGPLDWEIAPGERWIAMGPNGCGKSTLALALQGRMHPWEGDLEVLGVRFGGQPVQDLWKLVGFAGDSMERLLDETISIADYVVSASVGTVGLRFSSPTRAQTAQAHAELEFWGLQETADRPLDRVSLGQRRRAHIARALAPSPEFLLLDEPFAGLDPVARAELVERLESWTRRHPERSLLLVTHHVEEIPSTATHVLLLDRRGLAVACGPVATELNSRNLSLAFGHPLRLHRRAHHLSLDILGGASET